MRSDVSKPDAVYPKAYETISDIPLPGELSLPAAQERARLYYRAVMDREPPGDPECALDHSFPPVWGCWFDDRRIYRIDPINGGLMVFDGMRLDQPTGDVRFAASKAWKLHLRSIASRLGIAENIPLMNFHIDSARSSDASKPAGYVFGTFGKAVDKPTLRITLDHVTGDPVLVQLYDKYGKPLWPH